MTDPQNNSNPPDIGETGPQTDTSTKIQPAGTTRVDNGVAYDKSGKAIGQGNETPTPDYAAMAKQAGSSGSAIAPSTSKPDYAAMAKQAGSNGTPIQGAAPDYAALAKQAAMSPEAQRQQVVDKEKDYLQRTGQWQDIQTPGELGVAGTWHRFTHWVMNDLVDPNDITRAMTGYTNDQIKKELIDKNPGDDSRVIHVKGLGDYDLGVLFGGVQNDISNTAASQTNPLAIGTYALGPITKALGAARTLAVASGALKTASQEADAINVIHATRVSELKNLMSQASKAQDALQTAMEYKEAGTATAQDVAQARAALNEATNNVVNAQKAVKEITISKAETGVALSKASRNAQEARDVMDSVPSKILRAAQFGNKTETPVQVVAGLNAIQKGVGTTYTLGAAKEALTPREEGESLPDYIGRVVGNAGWAILGGHATASDIREAASNVKNSNEAFKTWYDAHNNESARETKKNDAAQQAAYADFKKAAPPGPNKANYTDADYNVVRPFMEDAHENMSDANTLKQQYSNLNDQQKGIENQVKPQLEKYGNESLSLGKNVDGSQASVRQRLVESLLPDEQAQTGFMAKALKAVDGFDLNNPTVEQAEAMRKKLAANLRGTLEKNNWDVATARQSDPEFAGMSELYDLLREGEYGALVDKGVTGAKEMRQAESSIIRVRNAVDRSIKNAETVKKNTSGTSKVRQIVGKVAGGTAGALIGGALGEASGIPGVGEALALGGAYAGKKLQDAIAPGDLTQDQLMKRSMQVSGARDTRPQLDTSNAGIPAEQPAPHPRENSPLNAELSTHYGEQIGDTPYRDLEKKFLSDVSIKKEHGVPLDGPEKKLLTQINTENAKDIIEAKKQAEDEAAAKAEQQDKDAKEAKKQQEAQAKADEAEQKKRDEYIANQTAKKQKQEQAEKDAKAAEKAAKKAAKETVAEPKTTEGKAEKIESQQIKAGQAKEDWQKQEYVHEIEKNKEILRNPSATAEEKEIAQRNVNDLEDLRDYEQSQADNRKPVPEYEVPNEELGDMPKSVMNKSRMATIIHELGHVFGGHIGGHVAPGTGVNGDEIVASSHPSVNLHGKELEDYITAHGKPPAKSRAAVLMDWNKFSDHGLFTKEKIGPHFTNIVDSLAGGMAADELFNGIERHKNLGAHGDLEILHDLMVKHLGFSVDEAVNITNNAIDRMKKKLDHPVTRGMILENAPVREANLDDTLHYSKERVASIKAEHDRRMKEYEEKQGNNQPDFAETGQRFGNVDAARQAKTGGRPAPEVSAQEVKPEPEKTHEVYDTQTGDVMSQHSSARRAHARVDKLDNEYGGYKYAARPIRKATPEVTSRVREITTGDPKVDADIKAGGGVPGGVLDGGAKKYVYFHDPETEGTFNLDITKVTPEAIKAKLEASRAQFRK